MNGKRQVCGASPVAASANLSAHAHHDDVDYAPHYGGRALFRDYPFGVVANGGFHFRWLFCFRAISVELANKQQVTVLLPNDSLLPQPGQTFAVYAVGKRFGHERYTAQLYAPHVAVVAGSRT